MFKHILSCIALLCLLSVLPVSAHAYMPPPHQNHTQAQLVSSLLGTGQNKQIQAGVAVTLDKDWKTYWRTAGETGLAPVFDWHGSTNVKDVKILYPAPTRFTEQDTDGFGYADSVTFPVEITPEHIGQAISLRLKLDLLVCNQLCVPETHRLSLDIPAGKAVVSPAANTIAQALVALPIKGAQPIFTLEKIWIAQDEQDNKIYLKAVAHSEEPPAESADMFVEHPSFPMLGPAVFTYDAPLQRLEIRMPFHTTDTLETIEKSLQGGALTLTYTDGIGHAFENALRLSVAPLALTPAKPLAAIALHSLDLRILLFAFLGGLILNLMPCVLPVLSLKILSVVSHGGKDHRIHRKEIFKNFMASALGILFSFWVMAGALAALKSAGQSIGWGIQFQHAGFLLFLITLLLIFAANMWGFFEIPLPRFIAKTASKTHEHTPTMTGHFMTGAFATLLATPCTAPFLGTAVGFALAREAFDIYAVFTFLGLGLAAPYIVLALSPRIFKYMPKPGKWMLTLRKILAVALLVTAAWLLNVLVTVTTQATLDEGWVAFNEALIKPAVENGKTVIVDVTADWCLTCKANKRLVLEQDDIMDALSNPNILRLQADWTQRDETISTYLKKYGRYGIPFNIVYGPAAPEGIILSELLTKKEVLDALAQATDE
jgi:suppressor for copper-sensitivity B